MIRKDVIQQEGSQHQLNGHADYLDDTFCKRSRHELQGLRAYQRLTNVDLDGQTSKRPASEYVGKEEASLQSCSTRFGVGCMDGFTTVPHLSGSQRLGFQFCLHNIGACVGHELREHTFPQSTVQHNIIINNNSNSYSKNNSS